jgi:hypothetical protein
MRIICFGREYRFDSGHVRRSVANEYGKYGLMDWMQVMIAASFVDSLAYAGPARE